MINTWGSLVPSLERIDPQRLRFEVYVSPTTYLPTVIYKDDTIVHRLWVINKVHEKLQFTKTDPLGRRKVDRSWLDVSFDDLEVNLYDSNSVNVLWLHIYVTSSSPTLETLERLYHKNWRSVVQRIVTVPIFFKDRTHHNIFYRYDWREEPQNFK